MQKKSHKKLFIACGVFAGLLCAWFIYLACYYRALPSAKSLVDAKEAAAKKTLVFYPSDKTINSSIGIIFYPGGSVEYTAYAPLMQQIADECGCTCFLLHVYHNLAILNCNRAKGITQAYPDISDWYVAGHSLGGSAASIFVKKHTDEFDGIIFLGSFPIPDLSDSSLRALFIFGSNDGILDRESYEKNKFRNPADFTEKVIEGANHAFYGSYGTQLGDGTASITPEQQQEITAQTIHLWLQNMGTD